MAQVRIRRFEVSPPGPGRQISARHIDLVGEGQFELNLAEVLRINALAVPYRGRLLMRLVRREMALVMSLFGQTPPGQPLTRHEAFDGSSLHIRRFATEVLALGALTALIRDAHPKLSDVAHFDALSPDLQAAYPNGGTRPDLRFAGAESILAGESRGRSHKPPVRSLTSPPQRRRLEELLAWSRQPGCDPVCMAWSWMQSDETMIDFFRFAIDTSAPPVDAALMWRLMQAADSGTVPRRTPGDTEMPWTAEQDPDRVGERSAKQRLIRRTIEDRESQLLESAPLQPVPGMREGWFGEWQSVPNVDDDEGARILLAVTRDAPEPAMSSSEPQRLKWSKESQLEVSAAGQVVVAIDWQARSEVEAGSEIERMLQPDVS